MDTVLPTPPSPSPRTKIEVFFETLDHLDYLQLFLVVGGLMIVWWFVQQSRSPESKIALQDIILGSDDKVSLTKVAQFGAFMVSTWGFIHLVVYNNLTEWYYTSYMIAWAGTQLATYWISRTKA